MSEAEHKADDNEADEKLDKMLSCVDAITEGVDALTKRMDALEKRKDAEEEKSEEKEGEDDVKAGRKDDGDDDEDEEKPQFLKKEELAADAMRRHSGHMADAQLRADSVAQVHGEKAPPPLSRETLRAYRMRLLRPYQHHSGQFKGVDLGAIKDPKLFDGIEQTIYTDAVAAGASPLVAEGHLRMVEKTAGGHIFHEFHGSPRAWMDEIAGQVRQYVTKINTGPAS